MISQQYNITVKGTVQGVWFRKHTQEKAITLSLKGFVMNQSNGAVYIEAVGENEKLDDLILWLKTKGSPNSVVTEVVFDSTEIKHNYTSFEIKR